MIDTRFRKSVSGRAMAWFALPLAAIVPLAVAPDAPLPFGLAQALSTAGQAQAATAKAKPKSKKKAATRKKAAAAATTKRVCTTTKVKGRKVTKCKTVKLVPAPVVITAPLVIEMIPAPPPVYIAPPPAPPPVQPQS
ncbi:MAG: hypothetical protein ABL914_06135, partial [Novosphingobium sp.]|uniref:hypothetical protein n=1 Tax=Novosphingobium sp. TaxID=1874826 RepID=UPI0032BBDBA1